MWEESDHIVLIRSDGSVVYEDGFWPEDYDDVRTLCDVMDSCSDCPRYGDDCDGEGGEEDLDDRIAYYEKQGDEYVYYDEDERELFREPV